MPQKWQYRVIGSGCNSVKTIHGNNKNHDDKNNNNNNHDDKNNNNGNKNNKNNNNDKNNNNGNKNNNNDKNNNKNNDKNNNNGNKNNNSNDKNNNNNGDKNNNSNNTNNKKRFSTRKENFRLYRLLNRARRETTKIEIYFLFLSLKRVKKCARERENGSVTRLGDF